MLIGIDANEANLTQSRVGVNQYAFDLLHALHAHSSSHQFVIYLKTPPGADLPPPTPTWTYRVIPFPKLWTQTRLPFDLYTHFPRPDVFLSLSHYAPRFSPIPSVVCIMDVGFLSSPEQFTSKDFNQLKSWTAYSVKQAKKIIAISEFTKQDILKHYSKNPDDIVVSYPGYDHHSFTPQTNPEVLKKYHISTPYLLFLSSLKPSKNLDGLIRAYSQLKLPHKLVIVGKKAWMFEQIFALVKELGLTDKVIFTGFADEADVPVLMSMSSAFVLPSFHEGFGIPVLEAMACGTPVVTSQVASLPEVGGSAAVYVDPHDVNSIAMGIKTALGPKRRFLVTAGLKQVKSFHWDRTAQEVIQVLQSAI